MLIQLSHHLLFRLRSLKMKSAWLFIPFYAVWIILDLHWDVWLLGRRTFLNKNIFLQLLPWFQFHVKSLLWLKEFTFAYTVSSWIEFGFYNLPWHKGSVCLSTRWCNVCEALSSEGVISADILTDKRVKTILPNEDFASTWIAYQQVKHLRDLVFESNTIIWDFIIHCRSLASRKPICNLHLR